MTTMPTPDTAVVSPKTTAGHHLSTVSDLLARRPDLHEVPLLGVVLAAGVRESA